jgi:GNAT superfamily N-acetyltransferase
MPNMMIVRPVMQDDVPRVAEIHVSSSREIYSGTFPDAHFDTFTVKQRIERFTEWLSEPSIAIDLIETNEIHGFAIHSSTRDPDLDSKGVYELQAIYIDPGQWRRGFGAALLNHVTDKAKCTACGKIALWVLDSNGQAVSFYQKWGYKPDGANKEAEVCNQKFSESRYVLNLQV